MIVKRFLAVTFSLKARFEAPPSPRKSSRRSSPKGDAAAILDFFHCYVLLFLVIQRHPMYTLAVRMVVQGRSDQNIVNICVDRLNVLSLLCQDCTFLNKKEVLRVLNRFLDLDKNFKKGNSSSLSLLCLQSSFPDPLLKEKLRKVRFPYSQVAKCPELRENPFR